MQSDLGLTCWCPVVPLCWDHDQDHAKNKNKASRQCIQWATLAWGRTKARQYPITSIGRKALLSLAALDRPLPDRLRSGAALNFSSSRPGPPWHPSPRGRAGCMVIRQQGQCDAATAWAGHVNHQSDQEMQHLRVAGCRVITVTYIKRGSEKRREDPELKVSAEWALVLVQGSSG